ncbi:MAG: polysaccharide biosynthesis/export family protein [Nitrospirota bacterium]|nr:polysaccharide biosynthesis/export family protein [Nitrospirota bacterium]
MKKILFVVLTLLIIATSLSYANDEYMLGPEDMIQILVWKNPELSLTIPVRPDGKISVPLVGDVQASGYTTTKLSEVITKRLTAYIQSPHVTVILTQINSPKVFVMGKGVTSNVVVLKRKTTLLELFSQIVLTPNSDLKNASLIRNNEKLPNRIKDLVAKGDLTQNIVLQPGDILYIPDSFW